MPVTSLRRIRWRHNGAAALQVRATTVGPMLLGGLAALVTVAPRVGGNDELSPAYALAMLCGTAGAGFALDDPATEILAASPTPLATRRATRIAVIAAVILSTWVPLGVVAVATRGRADFSLTHLAVELGALATIGLAVAAVVQHHTGRTGGPFAALIIFVGPVTMSALAFRNTTLFPSVLPGSPLHERWAWLALVAAAALTFTSREP